MKHNMSRTPEYAIWMAMKRRCHVPTANDYYRYGAIGIHVCQEWRSDFLSFYKHVGKRPGDKYSLDRIDNSRGYEPNNVRWATINMQANNKRTNRLVNYQGKTVSVANAVRMAGSLIQRETAICRLKNGWTVAEAVETPPTFKRDRATKRKISE